jgi:hypothetical protein
MWQRNECGLPSAAILYSSAGPALGTSGRGGRGENHPEKTRVEVENNTGRNFKDLEEMPGSAKAGKRRNGVGCRGVLLDPLKAPGLSRHADSTVVSQLRKRR